MVQQTGKIDKTRSISHTFSIFKKKCLVMFTMMRNRDIFIFGFVVVVEEYDTGDQTRAELDIMAILIICKLYIDFTEVKGFF